MAFRKIISSPLTYTVGGYFAVAVGLLAQNAVVDGNLIPGTIEINLLGLLVIPVTLIGPIVGVGMSVLYLIQRSRHVESILTLIIAMPILLIWIGVLLRVLATYN